jgi:TonB-linked SusC/RagA family outer membrane protein
MKTVYNLTKCVLVGAFLLLSMVVNAQIKGKVLSSEDNTGLPGASVVVKGTNKGVLTDTEGAFSIDAKSGDVLVVSFVGFETTELPAQDDMNFSMKPQSSVLQEVVTTALNIQKTKASTGYAVQDVKGIDLIKAREPNPSNNLVGKIAGLSVGASAELLGAPSILLRGRTPLYVVDGVPIKTDLWNISSDDIENISVLKGPTASALYGSAGQFGAIQISTKRGSKKGTLVEFTNSTMIENGFLTIPKVQDLYGPGDHGTYAFVDGKGKGNNDGDYDIWGPKFDPNFKTPQYDSPVRENQSFTTTFANGSKHIGNIEPTPWIARGANNLTRYLQPGLLNNMNLAISGGNDKFDYRLSGSYGYQNGITPNTSLNTGNVNLTTGLNLTDRLRFETNFNYSRQFTDNIPDVTYGPNSMIYNITIWGGADWDIDQLRNYWQPGKEGIQQNYAEYQRYNNPWFQSYEWTRGHYKNDLYGYGKLTYKLSENLDVLVRTQITSYNVLRNEKMPYSAGSYGNDERKGNYREDARDLFENNTDVLLSYKKNITDFSIKASVGANSKNFAFRSNYTTTDYLAVPGLYTFSNTLNPLKSANYRANMLVNSAYAFADFGYKTWAYLSVTGRYDQSSALLLKNNAFFYPSVSASILPSEMVKMGPISFMKLRASYARVGGAFTQNNIGGLLGPGYGSGYETPYGGPRYLEAVYNIQQRYATDQSASYQRFLLDPDLKPEFSTSIEAGTDIRFLNNRIGLDVNYFRSLDGPGIRDLGVSEASGPTAFRTNGIELLRTGIEISLTGNPIKTKDFDWNILVNYSTLKETLNKIDDNGTTKFNQFVNVGDRTDVYTGTAFARDPNGNIIYSGALPVRKSQNQILGYTNPDFVWGITNSFRYKGFQLGFQFDGRAGGVIGNYIRQQTFRGGRNIETVQGAMGVAREEDTKGNKTWVGQGVVVNNGAKINFDANGNIINMSELQFSPNTDKTYLQDWISRYYATTEGILMSRSFVKLREVTLGVAIPTSWLKNTFVREASLTFTGRNLLYWAEFDDTDVDQFNAGTTISNTGIGRANLQTPTIRRYGVSLNVKF